ncbi:DUF4062 domain-containing protein [Mariprofundus sp. NF]|uniref:DUF4062 domain-containing protein n=1 Tax=Mariprofundus sp. NF TaxID=2608716 RepID=UPI0015A43EAA|nr:DUF4062 domain-containing protein [Mariprofundus sp. NF]NWF38279.1 DUF4062 domain-containing protein [Mariprofundus sp. NF]
MSRVFRVFLSSTFQDWTVEREHLRHHVFPELAQWVEGEAHRLGINARFLPVDLRWGVSEEAGKTHATVDICLDEVRRCQEKANRPDEVIKPNFLVFLGQRYGWRPVPPKVSQDHWKKLTDFGVINDLFHACYEEDLNALPSEWVLKAVDGDWQNKEERLRKRLDNSYLSNEAEWKKQFTSEELAFLVGSVTEQEIVRGAFQAEDAEKHVHIFNREIKNPTAGFLSEDEHISPKLLGRLKEDITEKGFPIHTYDLDAAPKHGDNYLEEFGDDVRTALQSTIAYEFKILAESGEADVVDAPDLSCFVDREELNELMAWEGDKPLLLYGQAGTGKSTLLSAAENSMVSDNTVFTYWIGRDSRCASGMGLLQAIISDLNAKGFVEASEEFRMDELVSMDYQKLEEFVKITLQSLASSCRVIIDAIDQLPEGDAARNLRWLSSEAPVLLSTLDDPQKMQFSSMVSESAVITVSELGDIESTSLLDKWFGVIRSGKRMLQEVQKDALLKEYNGRPLHLRVLYERAISLRSFDGVPDWLGGEKQSTEDAISDLYNYLAREEEHGEVMVKRTLTYLASSPLGVPEDVLIGLLRNDDEIITSFRKRSPNSPNVGKDRLPEIVWSRLYHDLEPFLSRRSFFGEEYLDFYHAQFRRVVTEGDKPWVDVEVLNDCREKVEALAADWDNMPQSGLRNFLFRHGASNAIKLGETDAFKACGRLTSFGYLMARFDALSSSEINGYIDEYSLLESHVSEVRRNELQWKDWVRFIQGSSHLLTRGKDIWPANQILLQLATEYADVSPITVQAEQWLKEGHCDWFWMRRSNRPEQFIPTQSLYVMDGHTGPVSGVKVLSDNAVLSWSMGIEHDIRVWDLKLRKCLRVLTGHTCDVHGVEVLPDGRALSWSEYGEILVWNLESGEYIELEGHLLRIFDVQISPDCLNAISYSHDNTLRVFSLETGKCLHVLRHRRVRGVKLLPDNQALSFSADASICLWNLESGKQLHVLDEHAEAISGVEILQDNRALSFSKDATIRLWDLESGMQLHVLGEHAGAISGVEILPDAQMLSFSKDATLRLWDLEFGKQLHVLDKHDGAISGVEILPDNQALSFSEDRTLRLWDLKSGKQLYVLDKHAGAISGVEILPDNRALSWAKNDVAIYLWDLESGKQLYVLDKHAGAISGVEILSDNRALSWSEKDKDLRVWNLESGECLAVLDGHADYLKDALLLTDNRVLSFSVDTTIRLWDLELIGPQELNDSHTDTVLYVRVLHGNRALSFSEDETLRIWDLNAGGCIHVLEGHTKQVKGVHLLSDDRALSWSYDGVLRLWNLITGKCIQLFEGHTWEVNGVHLLSDDRALSWSYDGILRLWDLITGKCIQLFEGHTWNVGGVRLLSDDRALSWASDQTFRVWDLNAGRCIHVLEGHTKQVKGVHLLSDDRALSWAEDGILCLWDLESGKKLHVLDKHEGAISGVEILPDNQTLSFSEDGTLRLWDLKSGKQLQVLDKHTGAISGVEILPDAQVLSFSKDGMLRVWDLYTGGCIQVFEGHTGGIDEVHLLSDDRVLSCSSDKTLRVWNLNAGECIQKLEGHINWINRVKVLSDDLVLSKSIDGTLLLWNVESGKQLQKLDANLQVAVWNDAIPTIWFGNHPKLMGVSESGSWIIRDGGKKVKVLHPWQGNKRIDFKDSVG